MKYNLKFSIIPDKLKQFISTEIKLQKIDVLKATKLQLKELSSVFKEIEKHALPSYLTRKKLPHNLGYGIFLRLNAKPLLKGQVIAPYSGEMSMVVQNAPDDSAYAFDIVSGFSLDKKQMQTFDKNNRYHPRRLYAVKLDALKKGNFTRFINHSAKPNVEAHFVSIPKNSYGIPPSPLEVIYFVKKTILPGHQLLVSYEAGEESYWKASNIKPYPMTPTTFTL